MILLGWEFVVNSKLDFERTFTQKTEPEFVEYLGQIARAIVEQVLMDYSEQVFGLV